MKTEDIIKRLKNPQKYRNTQPAAPTESAAPGAGPVQSASVTRSRLPRLEIIVGVAVAAVFCLTLLFWMMSKNRAENLVAALDPSQLKGLEQKDAVFNPNKDVKFVEVREGQDRNVAVSNLGSTLPIISRFNFQTLTNKNYEIIGAAPWALTTNFQSNLSDPEMIRYLLANDTMINAFLTRDDVAPLLEDPQLLAALCEDPQAMQSFFTQDTVQAVLADPQLVRTVLGSRFMSYLLISKSGKYFRTHPQEAAAVISQSPYLAALRQNEGVVTAVKENPYLKNIARELLATPAAEAARPAAQPTAARQGKTDTKTKNSSRIKK